MPFDVYYARLNQMVSQGRFEHIGRASIRFEGATARGVWLRVDHWSIAMEKRPQVKVWRLLPCGQPHSIFPWSSQRCAQVLVFVAHF